MTETRKFSCTNCSKEVGAEVPEYEIVNQENFSMFIMTHEKKLVCDGCGQAFQFYITGVKSLQFGWKAKAPVDDGNKAIIPPKNTTPRIIMPEGK